MVYQEGGAYCSQGGEGRLQVTLYQFLQAGGQYPVLLAGLHKRDDLLPGVLVQSELCTALVQPSGGAEQLQEVLGLQELQELEGFSLPTRLYPMCST